ncbi:MAG: 5'-nucleotidase C-terminal domain-containing protein [Bacteroidales bacterium]|nr:5'-nucleotidase C-terminal domain-containing protein [Bacteroidales bacterium]
MAETKVKNRSLWYLGWALIIVGAVVAGVQAMRPKGPQITWQRVFMDGHRAGIQSVTAENIETALGTFTDEGYRTPAGVLYDEASTMAEVAAAMMEVQPRMAHLKQVIGHSDHMMMNDRDNPDLPLGNVVADAMRAFGTRYFKVPMDFAVTNFGGIRVPMPEGAVTLEDISAMFPFKNYVCYVKMTGANLTTLLEQLSEKKAFQATSGATVRVKAHQLESALVGGKPIDPERIYHVTTIDFLLDGGDQLRIGALAEDVVLTDVLLKDVMLDYVKGMEAAGKVINGVSDGRVVMED